MDKIRIYSGDTIGWNDEKPYRFVISSEIDLTGFTAEFAVGNIIQEYELATGESANTYVFDLLMTSSETAALPKGENSITIKVLDPQKRVKTISKRLRMEVV